MNNSTTDTDAVDQLPLPADLCFSTVEAVISAVETAPAEVDAITVVDVGHAQFAAIDKALKAAGRKTRLFYFAEEKRLVITVPNAPHERLHLNLYSLIRDELCAMGLKRQWLGGAGRLPGPGMPAGSGSQGEGDCSGGPTAVRSRKGCWPTLVIEAGFSQSLPSLRQKMRFWFSASGHDVKIVVLVKAFPASSEEQKRILIEQWQEEHVAAASSGLGAVTPRAAAMATRLEPTCVQTINVMWALSGVRYADANPAEQEDPSNFVVTRGPLRLDFERLFLRPPNPPMEGDVVVADIDLQLLAAAVWIG